MKYYDPAYKAGAIDILHQGNSEVIFSFNQIMSSQDSLVSVVYQDGDDSWTCDNSGEALPHNYKRSFKATCDASGVATVDVYVHNPSWTADHVNPLYSSRPGQCDVWSPIPGLGLPSGVALVSYELSCGECADCVPGCPEEIQLAGTIGQTMYPRLPITITRQDEHSVSFSVEQTWAEKATIYTRFDEVAAGASQCYEVVEVEKFSKQDYTAHCIGSKPVTLVHIWVVEETFSPADDTAEVPVCCVGEDSPDYPAVQYSFLLSCTPLCPDPAQPARMLRGGRAQRNRVKKTRIAP